MRAEQLRAARALLRMSQQDLAEQSGVSLPTIKRIEVMSGEIGAHTSTIRALQSALEAAGIAFIDQNGGGAGVRLAQRSD